MTGPEQAPKPSVTTAPAEGATAGAASPRAPLGRRRLPPHIGPARTSTVVLALAFVAIGMLYLFVKPPETRAVGDPTPATSRSAAPTTAAPPPATTTEEEVAPEETPAPTSEAAPTTSGSPEESTPEDSTVEEGTVEETGAPTTAAGTTSAPAPETSEPPPTTAAPSS